MSNEMIERVAIAISGAPFPSKASKTKARAAIEAMREPTPEMRQVVAANWGRKTWAEYQDVIDAALKGADGT